MLSIITNWKGLEFRQTVRDKPPEVCPLLQTAETQDLSSLLSYPRPYAELYVLLCRTGNERSADGT